MNAAFVEFFNDPYLIKRIKTRLPNLFQLAELESSRAGKIGMEVGSVREKIIIALFQYKFGEKNVDSDLPITEPEIDALVHGLPISIKTISSKSLIGIKLIWTVDAKKSLEFYKNYQPKYDLLIVQIIWNDLGGFYYIPVEAQQEVFEKIGRNEYLKPPKPGTNPRGTEISRTALHQMVDHQVTRSISINWQKTKIDFNPYKKWYKLWRES